MEHSVFFPRFSNPVRKLCSAYSDLVLLPFQRFVALSQLLWSLSNGSPPPFADSPISFERVLSLRLPGSFHTVQSLSNGLLLFLRSSSGFRRVRASLSDSFLFLRFSSPFRVVDSAFLGSTLHFERFGPLRIEPLERERAVRKGLESTRESEKEQRTYRREPLERD